jgi:hypothetical protein
LDRHASRGAIFIPLFLLSSKQTSPFLMRDEFRLALIVVFGVANGANFSAVNMVAPKRIQQAEKMHVGTLLTLMAVDGNLSEHLSG